MELRCGFLKKRHRTAVAWRVKDGGAMAAAIAMAAMADVAGRRKMAEFFFLSAVGVGLTRSNPTRKLNENHDPPYLSERCCNPRSFNIARPRNQPRPLQPASEPAARDPLHTAASSDDPWRERRRRERRRRPRTATSTYTGGWAKAFFLFLLLDTPFLCLQLFFPFFYLTPPFYFRQSHF